MKLFYRLDGRTPVALTTLDELAQAAASLGDMESRTVRRTKIGHVHISTVFTVIYLGMGLGPPLLFESMIFGGKFDGEQMRYGAFEEAEWGHFALICKVWMGEEWPQEDPKKHYPTDEVLQKGVPKGRSAWDWLAEDD